jgi:hypothetical protein
MHEARGRPLVRLFGLWLQACRFADKRAEIRLWRLTFSWEILGYSGV